MKTSKIKTISPIVAGAETDTPGRKGLQIIFESEGLDNDRTSSRNFWDTFIGKGAKSGQDLKLVGDSLYGKILAKAGDLSKFDWKKVVSSTGEIQTPSVFQGLIGAPVAGERVTKYVEPYIVANTTSKNPLRVTVSVFMFEGESVVTVFQQQQHVLASEAEIPGYEALANQIAKENSAASEVRRAEKGLPARKDPKVLELVGATLANIGQSSTNLEKDPVKIFNKLS